MTFTVKRMNEQASHRQGENISEIHLIKELVSKMYNEWLKFNNKATNNLIKKCAKNLDIHLTKDTQVADKNIKICSTMYVIGELANYNDGEIPLCT